MTTIQYHLSKSALDNEYILTGKRMASKSRQIALDDTTLTSDQRALLVKAQKTFYVTLETYSVKPIHLPNTPLAWLKRPAVTATTVEFEREPALEEIFIHIDRMISEYTVVSAEAQALMPEYDRLVAERAAQQAAEVLQRQAEKEVRLAAQAEERERKAIIVWNDTGKAIVNLYEAVFAASELSTDQRFNSWVKEVTSIDKSQPNGYSIVGNWINDRTVEAVRGKHVYLVAATTGSRKYQTTNYVVVIMDELGTLLLTDIATDDTDAGWALRIRDDIAALID